MTRRNKAVVVGLFVTAVALTGVVTFWWTRPIEVSGMYFHDLEVSALYSRDYPGEVWWVEAYSDTAIQVRAVIPEGNSPRIAAFVRLLGRKSQRREPPPGYGHLGMSHREFHVLRVLDVRPVTEDDLRRFSGSEEEIGHSLQMLYGPAQPNEAESLASESPAENHRGIH